MHTPHAAAPAAPATAAPAAPSRLPSRRARLRGQPALLLLASLLVSLLAASSAPTPLYAIYQQRWGFSPVTTTIVFGIYSLAVLASLLTLGRLSDYTGRRPVLLAALAGQAASLLVYATAGGVAELLAARVIQGLSTGAAIGAIGAAMLDISRERGALANALAPGIGTGTGALASALAIRFLPAPEHLIYLALLAVIAVQAAGVALLRETAEPGPVPAAAFVPDVRLPRAVRAAVLAAAPVLFATWALAGLYGALGPALVSQLTGSASIVLGGLAMTVLTVTAAGTVFLLRGVAARTVMLAGVITLAGGVTVTLAAITAGSAALFFAGTAIAGAGFGAGFQGGLRTVVPYAAPHERAGVLSLLFVIAYLGLGVPAVAAGFAVAGGLSLASAARGYGLALIALAALALAGLYQTRPRDRRETARETAGETAVAVRPRPGT